ncbi:MAG: hypothetical protein GWN00_06425, partial [Aliifodinibius sp.]|nr:hypothetical protein [Fodinibius sp.]NIV10854.1 hypothetical protein [Fodinibius sp.]NIY24451.1 hypothetical protein [Fodinibius sp.]
MRIFTIVLISFFSAISLYADEYQEWIRVQFDPNIAQIQMLVQDGTIEAESNHAKQGWMLESNYRRYSKHFSLQRLASELREVEPHQISISPDSLGQVLATYPMPPEVQSERGLGYDGTYFYVVDADFGNEKVYKLDPNNNFAVVSSFSSPGSGTKIPWGIESDGQSLYMTDAIFDLIFKTDTSGAVIYSFPTGGPLASGLGYRTNELWNADLGDISGSPPPRVYVSDTLGISLGNYTLANAVNGVAAHDSAIIIG